MQKKLKTLSKFTVNFFNNYKGKPKAWDLKINNLKLTRLKDLPKSVSTTSTHSPHLKQEELKSKVFVTVDFLFDNSGK